MLSNEEQEREDQLHEKGVQFLKEASKEEQLRLLWMMSRSFYFPTVDYESEGVILDTLSDGGDDLVPIVLDDDGTFLFNTTTFVRELNEEISMKQVKDILDDEE
jgi:hypothetical protein